MKVLLILLFSTTTFCATVQSRDRENPDSDQTPTSLVKLVEEAQQK